MNHRILHFLSSLPGVIDSAEILRKDVSVLTEIEEASGLGPLVTVKNLGVQVVLERDRLAVILKDSSFRPPPCPTIYLVEESKGSNLPPVESLHISGASYRIIGEEVMGTGRDYAEKHMFIDDGLVLFPERRENKRVPAFFILPPIPFPELENEKSSFAIENIVSVSPSTQGDEFLRSSCNFSKAPEYATILIGWNLRTEDCEHP